MEQANEKGWGTPRLLLQVIILQNYPLPAILLNFCISLTNQHLFIAVRFLNVKILGWSRRSPVEDTTCLQLQDGQPHSNSIALALHNYIWA